MVNEVLEIICSMGGFVGEILFMFCNSFGSFEWFLFEISDIDCVWCSLLMVLNLSFIRLFDLG